MLTKALTLLLFGSCTLTTIMGQDIIVFEAVPGSIWTDVQNINNQGTIVGHFHGPLSDPVVHGYIRDYNGTITIFDVPNATATTPTGINDLGEVVGTFTTGPNSNRGFLRGHWGNIIIFDAPGDMTVPASINNHGDIIGEVIGSSTSGFRRDHDGTITPVPDMWNPCNINNHGDVAGPCSGYWMLTRNDLGQIDYGPAFVWHPDGTRVAFRGSQSTNATIANHINSHGAVVGCFYAPAIAQPMWTSFIRDPMGNITQFNVPGAWTSCASSINDNGYVAGMSNQGVFIRDPNGGVTYFTIPNAYPYVDKWGRFGQWDPNGPLINNRGDVAGTFYETTQWVNGLRGYIRPSNQWIKPTN
jgi:uncharacterized membrane protein